MSPHLFEPNRTFAEKLDLQDDLAAFYTEFQIQSPKDGNPEIVYLDGNSLGRLPRRTIKVVEDLVREQWGQRLVRGWGEGWFTAPQRIGEKIGRLIGAAPGQVIACDSTSVNLYKLVMAALRMRPGRTRIVSDTMNFPSDLYILHGCIDTLGSQHQLHLIPSPDGVTPDLQALEDAIDENTALVVLSHVAFKSGYLYDAGAVTRRAHHAGALVLWDLSHSTGSVPVALDDWGADFAIGCTYKYLNGGPGSPAFLYVRNDLQEEAVSPIWGWFGQKSPFSFALDYEPQTGISRFLAGTPPVLSMVAMEQGVDLLLEAGIDRLRRKSVLQTDYLIDLFDEFLAPLGFTLGTPRQSVQRGSHISIRHPEGYRINRSLIDDSQVIPDFRTPDNIRLGIAPIYTRYIDIWEAVDRIIQVVKQGTYRKYSPERPAVT